MLNGDLKNSDTCFGHLEEKPIFQNTTLLVIVFNAVWIFIDVQWNHVSLMDADGKLPLQPASNVVEQLFCVYFTGEVVIRFIALRHKRNLIFDAWFLFDFTLVAFMVLETWCLPIIGLLTQSEGGASPLSSFSSFRLLRLLRLTRMARIMRFFPELMALVKGMISAAKAVFFVLLFLIIITYIFAILFTSELGDPELPEPEEGADPTGKEMFSDLGSSMMSLFTRGVLGDNLASTLIAIKEESLILMWVFILFVVICGLTLLNMLIGVLCSVVEETSKNEEEAALAEEMKETLQQTFRAADTSNDGMVSADEWEKIRESKEVHKLLERMGVEPKQMEMRLGQMKETLFGQSSAREAAMFAGFQAASSEVLEKSKSLEGRISPRVGRGGVLLEAGGQEGGEIRQRRVSTTSFDKKDHPKEGVALAFDDFVEKVLELRMDVPASALDIELCKAQAASADKIMNKTLGRIEENLSSLIAQSGSQDSSSPKHMPGDHAAREALRISDGQRGAGGETAPAWLREIPTDMLFHVLKSRNRDG